MDLFSPAPTDLQAGGPSGDTGVWTLPLAKRAFDVVLSAGLLLLISPLLLLVIAAIFGEGLLVGAHRGPIFYGEKRISQGEPFLLRKFRIFKVSAYQPTRDEGGTPLTKALEKDPANLTATGRILKAFYLDEIPQLWNVLCGDMTFVGPRPWIPLHYDEEIALGIYRKKIAKAGLTGPVQANKAETEPLEIQRQVDAEYIGFSRAHSGLRVLLNDVRIIFQTLVTMLQGEGL